MKRHPTATRHGLLDVLTPSTRIMHRLAGKLVLVVSAALCIVRPELMPKQVWGKRLAARIAMRPAKALTGISSENGATRLLERAGEGGETEVDQTARFTCRNSADE
jgi:hypothetical protein